MPQIKGVSSPIVYRLALGVGQGFALYLLFLAREDKVWPATSGLVFAPLLLLALFLPLLMAQAVGNLRPRTFALWSIAAALIVAILAGYDIWRAWPVDWVIDYRPSPPGTITPPVGSWQPHILPSWPLLVALPAALFITQALVLGGDNDRRFIATYTTHFDVAWKLAVQAALSAAFVGLFWGLLWLGAGLFDLVKLDFLTKLYRHQWFWIPATTTAIAVAIHITDTRAALVRGTRTLILTLSSLLLPLMAAMVGAFLVALIFTGLDPLWRTRYAAALLMVAAAALIVLINTAYQDGSRERVAAALRYAGSLAAIILVPLVGLAGYGLAQRVLQYGWSVGRIELAAVILVAGCYAVGYTWAALSRGVWLKHVERWNFYTSLVILAVFLALFTPLADPARISVASQLARLNDDRVTIEKFDFAFLRWDAGRYGETALEAIAADAGRAQATRDTADRLLQATNRYAPINTPHALASNLVAHTPDGKLPDSFLKQNWSGALGTIAIPRCLTAPAQSKCDAFVKDLKNDGSTEILIVQDMAITGFQTDSDGTWHAFGRWYSNCPASKDALQSGQFEAVPPVPAPWPDIEAPDGMRLRFTAPFTPQPCPKP